MTNVARDGLVFRGLWWTAGLAAVAGLIVLSLVPEPPGLPGDRNGWVAHTMAYALLMGWFCRLLAPGGPRAVAAIALCALGVAIEFAQGATGYRSFDTWDMAADALGVAIGALASPPRVPSGLALIDAVLARRLRTNPGGQP
jgi:hypothetical protein